MYWATKGLESIADGEHCWSIPEEGSVEGKGRGSRRG